MTARDRLRQVFYRCVEDARTEPSPIREASAGNAAILADVILNCNDEQCQARVELLLRVSPELFPS